MIGAVVVAVVSYLSGSIPFSYIAGRVFGGVDLREHGSGNLGASNTFRFLGPKIAIGVLVMDILKGFVPVFFAPAIAGAGLASHWAMMLAAFFAVFGHMFSAFMKFKGGKGVATTAGTLVALAPLALLFTFLVFAAAFAATRIVSLGSLVSAIALPVSVFAVERLGWADYHVSVLYVALAITFVVLIKHRSNIQRLMAGNEPKLRRHNAP